MLQVDTCHVLFVDADTANLVRSWRGISGESKTPHSFSSDSPGQIGHTHFVITTLSQLSDSHSGLLNRIDSYIQSPTPGCALLIIEKAPNIATFSRVIPAATSKPDRDERKRIFPSAVPRPHLDSATAARHGNSHSTCLGTIF